MNNIEAIVKELLILEEKSNIDKMRILDFPIWNIVKYKVRGDYIVKKTKGDKMSTSKRTVSSLLNPFFLWNSFWSFNKILFGLSKADSILMGFSRPEYFKGLYIDKFLDPVIELTELKNSYLYFEYGKGAKHKLPRMHSDHICYTEFIHVISYLISKFLSYPFCFFYNREITLFKDKIDAVLDLSYSKRYFSSVIVEFKILVYFYSIILKRTGAKRIFGVNRVLFKPISFAAHKRGLVVYELQHGVAFGPTRLESGVYEPEIDPDYYLLFGESCPRDIFGMPVDRVINVGWAFNEFLLENNASRPCNDSCLVISEPHISNKIINITIQLAQCFPNIIFHIRRHPMEEFSIEQSRRFSNIPNIIDTTDRENSGLVVMKYRYVIGENSTVLFEALQMGKNVGRLSFGGLSPLGVNEEDSFYYIHSVEDFGGFLSATPTKPKTCTYSPFKKNLFNSFLS